MDVAQVAAVRELLTGSPWLRRSEEFAAELMNASHEPGSLLLVGTPAEEPWHLAAHLDQEARDAGAPELVPVLVRHVVPPAAPPHLAIGLERLRETRRGEALFVVAPAEPPADLLERVDDARRRGTTILALAKGAPELAGIAHARLDVPSARPVGEMRPSEAVAPLLTLDTAEHLVSIAAGAAAGMRGHRRVGLRDRLGQLLDTISGPRVDRW
jgi:hypothetical protein